MRFALTAFAAACAAPIAATPAAPPRFDPIAFFTGHTEGQGDIKVVLHAHQVIAVHGHGSVEPDGTLVLDQLVEQQGKPRHRREWRLRAVAPGRYAGTLTDATGPVVAETDGDRLHIAYRMKGHLAVRQWLTLGADGRSAHNVMRVTKRGIPVAHLDETIRRTGG